MKFSILMKPGQSADSPLGGGESYYAAFSLQFFDKFKTAGAGQGGY